MPPRSSDPEEIKAHIRKILKRLFDRDRRPADRKPADRKDDPDTPRK
jgi:hypothetical protein